MASEMRFAEVRKMLEAKGYALHHVAGSHHIFKKSALEACRFRCIMEKSIRPMCG